MGSRIVRFMNEFIIKFSPASFGDLWFGACLNKFFYIITLLGEMTSSFPNNFPVSYLEITLEFEINPGKLEYRIRLNVHASIYAEKNILELPNYFTSYI